MMKKKPKKKILILEKKRKKKRNRKKKKSRSWVWKSTNLCKGKEKLSKNKPKKKKLMKKWSLKKAYLLFRAKKLLMIMTLKLIRLEIWKSLLLSWTLKMQIYLDWELDLLLGTLNPSNSLDKETGRTRTRTEITEETLMITKKTSHHCLDYPSIITIISIIWLSWKYRIRVNNSHFSF